MKKTREPNLVLYTLEYGKLYARKGMKKEEVIQENCGYLAVRDLVEIISPKTMPMNDIPCISRSTWCDFSYCYLRIPDMLVIARADDVMNQLAGDTDSAAHRIICNIKHSALLYDYGRVQRPPTLSYDNLSDSSRKIRGRLDFEYRAADWIVARLKNVSLIEIKSMYSILANCGLIR